MTNNLGATILPVQNTYTHDTIKTYVETIAIFKNIGCKTAKATVWQINKDFTLLLLFIIKD